MPVPVVLSLPARDTQLRDEIIQGLEPYAEVHEAPPTFDLEAIKLIIEVAASVTSIASFLLMLKDRMRKESPDSASEIKIARLGEPTVPLKDVDDATLRRILGGDV